MRRFLLIASATLALVAVFLPSTTGQIDARNSVPDTIQGCYLNTTAYNRFARLPMHIDNLIAIIRKIETKTNGQWDARRISRVLVHRFMFDGMMFIANSKPEFAYRQKPEERAKSLIIKDLIPISIEESLPDNILDNDEKCALHWMLSHSMNATMRDEESNPSFGYPGYSGPGYSPGGSNVPGGGNNPFSNNNNNNNGFFNSGTGSNSNSNGMGNNQWGRRKRDVSENNGEESGSTKNEENNSHSDSKEYDEGISNENQDDYETQSGKSDANSNNAKQSLDLEVAHDDPDADVDHLPNVSSGSSSKSGRQIAAQQQDRKRTRRPIETGVVYTKWGNVAAGRLIGGIAAGLEPNMMSVGSGATYKPESTYGGPNPWSGGSGLGTGNGPWKSGNGGQPQYPGQGQQQPYPGQQPQSSQNHWGRRKRQIQVPNLSPLESLYAATLAGDAGQAAIINGQNEMGSAMLPSGEFNDTICPREYILQEHPDPSKEIYKPQHSWTYLTEAEIRGGVDGIILGSNIRRWDPSINLRLSDILEQYYSERGISKDPQYRSCDRSSLLSSSVDGNKLKEQTRSFAYLYNNKTNEVSDQLITYNPNSLENIVTEAYNRMYGAASSLSSTGPGCIGSPVANDDVNDNQKQIVPKITVFAVLDHSDTVQGIDQQRRFLGQLAYDLNVSPAGSRLGVVDGSSGSILISPNWTDVASVLACRISSLNSQTKNQDYSRAVQGIRGELERVRTEEQRYNFTNQNGVIILFMVQGRRLEAGQRNDVIRLTDEINRDVYGGVSIVATSSKYPEGDFEGLQFIKLQQGNQNFSDFAAEFSKSLLRNTHGALRYIYCNAYRYNQDNEHKDGTTLFITPGTISYYQISPDYFFSSRSMILRFTSDNGRVRVCISRKNRYPNGNNEADGNVDCETTSGNYVAVGQNNVDVEFRDGMLHKACGKHGKREDCDPIYISISTVRSETPGSTGLDCSQEGCQSSNQVKVTFTHWDMRCNGAMRTLISSTVALIFASIALLNWLKTT